MQLGFIVAPLGQKVDGQYPNEINYSYGGNGTFLDPYDPGFNTRGEQAFFVDTALGGIPTDAELATVYGRTPVASGWINAQEGYFPAPWRTPGGWDSAGQYGPQMSLSGVASTIAGLPLGAKLALAGIAGLAGWIAYKRRK